jgi:EmrB/QacA subfamily drug resistance transporter
MAEAPQRLERSSVVALAAMAMAVFVIANDVTALSVALPQIEQDFDADIGTVQWVISAYALIFGVLIVTGGRLADLLGRRRVFFAGAAIFAFFSLLGGLAPNALTLILARALMGIGGALMWPAILGMTYALLPASRAALAGALIIGAAGFGNAAGPLIGGVLTDVLDWRWILFLNLPIAALASLVTWRYVGESRGETAERRFDYAGVATLSVGLIALLIALDEVPGLGWGDPLVLGLFAVCVALLIAFGTVERRAGARALVPPDVLSNRTFRSACLAVLLMSATFFVALMYLPQLMQKSLAYTPVEAGLGMLPMMGVFAAVSFTAGPLYERFGPRPVLAVGATFMAAGPFLISLIEQGDSWTQLVPGMVVLGAGVGLFYSSITTAAVTALDPSRSSLAGGIVYMFQVAGGSVGLGVATTVFDSVQRSHDFATAFTWSFRLVAALALAGLLVTILSVRPEDRDEAPAGAGAGAAG